MIITRCAWIVSAQTRARAATTTLKQTTTLFLKYRNIKISKYQNIEIKSNQPFTFQSQNEFTKSGLKKGITFRNETCLNVRLFVKINYSEDIIHCSEHPTRCQVTNLSYKPLSFVNVYFSRSRIYIFKYKFIILSLV